MLDILSGVTVVDLTSNVAGPFCTLILRDLGATVWKVEPPDTGDVVRRWPPFTDDGVSTTFAALNRGKQSVCVDLKTDAGRAAFLAMIGTADVLVDSVRPGSLEKLGLTAEALAARNPDLVRARISAFGASGTRAGAPGFDAVIQAYTGLMDLTGYPDQPPARVGTGLVDFGTGMWAALGVLAALLDRQRGRQGADVSTTLFGTAVGFLMHHLASVELAGVVPARIGTAQHNTAPYEAIAASDGLVMVGVTGPALWQAFCTAIDDPALAEDPRYADNGRRVAARGELHERIETVTRAMTTEELAGRLTRTGVPCSPIRDVAELAADPELAATGLWQESAHGKAAVIPLMIDGTTANGSAPAPMLGEHTEHVLASVEGAVR
ncbi:MAG TPA: CoA transferase [Pseudonocardiaceae bacterium]|nr:CoA transferase [Pseudonocardiaceae bacterium]